MEQSDNELSVIACEFLKKWGVHFHLAIETDLVNTLKEVRDHQLEEREVKSE